jgi:hypothetical protein
MTKGITVGKRITIGVIIKITITIRLTIAMRTTKITLKATMTTAPTVATSSDATVRRTAKMSVQNLQSYSTGIFKQRRISLISFLRIMWRWNVMQSPCRH